MILSPIWSQNEHYDAREDRQVLSVLCQFTEHVARGLAVTPRGSGANMSVDVAPGMAFVQGDDATDQGFYLVVSTAAENVPLGTAPSSGTRIDVIGFRVNDPQAGGSSGAPAELVVIAGAAGGGAPALPPSTIALAQVAVSAGQSSVVAGSITDARPSVPNRLYVDTRAPTAADGRDGDLWLMVQ
jgi:hypothetical protein